MGSFASKLARLMPMSGASPAHTAVAAGAPLVARAPIAERARVLDDLRDRIARIVGRDPTPTRCAEPLSEELPFTRQQTPQGPLYVRRVTSLPAARVGRAPLVAARSADAGMLALLALDPSLAQVDPRRALYLDTETTGLAQGTGTVAFLVGLAWYCEASNAWVLEQVLLRRLGEEAPMLALVAERIAAASALVTFNGKAFDLPLLRTRFVMNRMEKPREPPHLDLVHVARRVHGARLPVRTLAAIEHEVLGRVRTGDVAGADIVQCYLHFLRTGEEGALLGVVEHNEHDVLSMVALVGLYGEPVGALGAHDLAGAARVVRRAGDVRRATELAEHAVATGGGAFARRVRGELAKARGDRARALEDYEAIAEELDDPRLRLELAKLYEHHVKAYARALALCEAGTGEVSAAVDKRRQRLLRKMERGSASRLLGALAANPVDGTKC